MTASTLLGAAAQLAVVAVAGWVAGGLLVDLLRRLGGPGTLWDLGEADWPERALLAVVGLVALSAALMVVHLVTGGAVFGVPGVVPLVLFGIAWWGWRRRRLPRGLPWPAIAGAALALGLVYALPAIAGGSGLRTGDTPWHMGWTEQLLAGDPVPTGPAPRFGANAYPWGFHAVLATMVRSIPGTTPQVAVEALGVLLATALPLAAACLARRIRADAGWWAAGAAGCVGGFGWLGAHDVEFVTSPSEARFGADLVVASPNSVYELFPPALPRELGLVLLAGAGLMLLSTLRSSGGRAGLAPGLATGLVGLVSVPMFVSAALWALLAGVLHEPGSRRRFAGSLGLAALATFALWASPVATDLVRFGGFVDITPRLGREWPLPQALAAWGLLFPLALGGAALTMRRGGRSASALTSWALATALLLALARIRALLDWGLGGNATVLHQGRVWPVAHLLGSVLAGVALAWLARTLTGRWRAMGALGAALALAAGAVSPVLASRSLTGTIRAQEGGFTYGAADLAPGSFLRRVAARVDSSDVLEVRGPPRLALVLWQFSGVRLASYDDPRLERNDLRIRFRELARAWDRRMEAGGFQADLLVVPRAGVPPGARVLDRGRFGSRTWAFVTV